MFISDGLMKCLIFKAITLQEGCPVSHEQIIGSDVGFVHRDFVLLLIENLSCGQMELLN